MSAVLNRLIALMLVAVWAAGSAPRAAAQRSARYEDLVQLFSDWRAFQKPKFAGGVPD